MISLGGKRILIDPVFGNIPFYKRKTPFPYDVSDLGNIDILCISHTHYDHLDKKSIKKISDTKQAILPLKMSQVVKQILVNTQIVELDWYDCFNAGDIKITFTPASHWGRRTAYDQNKVLWGGFVFEYQNKCIYFAGDSAYDEHFKDIGKKFNITHALLPIGAYEPAHIMKYNHLNPQQAYDAFKDLNAKKMIPMHYGTFKLSDEDLSHPLEWIQDLKKKDDDIYILDIGKVLLV